MRLRNGTDRISAIAIGIVVLGAIVTMIASRTPPSQSPKPQPLTAEATQPDAPVQPPTATPSDETPTQTPTAEMSPEEIEAHKKLAEKVSVSKENQNWGRCTIDHTVLPSERFIGLKPGDRVLLPKLSPECMNRQVRKPQDRDLVFVPLPPELPLPVSMEEISVNDPLATEVASVVVPNLDSVTNSTDPADSVDPLQDLPVATLSFSMVLVVPDAPFSEEPSDEPPITAIQVDATASPVVESDGKCLIAQSVPNTLSFFTPDPCILSIPLIGMADADASVVLQQPEPATDLTPATESQLPVIQSMSRPAPKEKAHAKQNHNHSTSSHSDKRRKIMQAVKKFVVTKGKKALTYAVLASGLMPFPVARMAGVAGGLTLSFLAPHAIAFVPAGVAADDNETKPPSRETVETAGRMPQLRYTVPDGQGELEWMSSTIFSQIPYNDTNKSAIEKLPRETAATLGLTGVHVYNEWVGTGTAPEVILADRAVVIYQLDQAGHPVPLYLGDCRYKGKPWANRIKVIQPPPPPPTQTAQAQQPSATASASATAPAVNLNVPPFPGTINLNLSGLPQAPAQPTDTTQHIIYEVKSDWSQKVKNVGIGVGVGAAGIGAASLGIRLPGAMEHDANVKANAQVNVANINASSAQQIANINGQALITAAKDRVPDTTNINTVGVNNPSNTISSTVSPTINTSVSPNISNTSTNTVSPSITNTNTATGGNPVANGGNAVATGGNTSSNSSSSSASAASSSSAAGAAVANQIAPSVPAASKTASTVTPELPVGTKNVLPVAAPVTPNGSQRVSPGSSVAPVTPAAN